MKGNTYYGSVDESSSEQLFHKSDVITFVCEKSGAIHLAQPGLNGRLADKI